MNHADPLGQFVRTYIDRVVNQHDLSGVVEMVSPDYQGGGHNWPATMTALLAFYRTQALSRPDWRIDVQETVEVDGCVVVRAHAGGTITRDETGQSLEVPVSKRVEWLAAYWITDDRISRIQLLCVLPFPGSR
ncbi:MAG: nuclear transport factor 2 family protein [Mycobacteriales bacterium]